MNPTIFTAYQFCRIFGIIFTFSHVFGCLWFVVGSSNDHRSWINFM